MCIMRACVRACAAFVRVLGAVVGVEGCFRGLVAACMHSPGDGDGDGVAGSGWLFRVFSGAVMAVEGRQA